MTLGTRFTICLLAGLTSLSPVSVDAAQRNAPRNRRDAPTKSEDTPQRLDAIMRVRALTERVLEFQNLKHRTRILMEFSDLLWQHDQPFARQLMFNALDRLDRTLDITKASGQEQSSKATLKSAEIAGLRREVIARIARRDPEWAWRLASEGLGNNETTGAKEAASYQTYLVAALGLVNEKPSEAVRFAEQSLRGGVSQTTVQLLQLLRGRDEAAARNLFLHVLSALAKQPVVNANDLLAVGTYVFSFPGRGQTLGTNAVWWSLINNLMVVNIYGGEPAVPFQDVRAYIETAMTVLGRSVGSSEQKQSYYVACYQLAPYVLRYAPDRVSELDRLMQFLLPDLPAAVTRPDTYASLAPSPSDQGRTIAELEKEPNLQRRDGAAVRIAHTACLEGNTDSARAVTQLVSDGPLRYKLNTIIDFFEGIKLLEQGNIALAEEKLNKMETGIERTLLCLSLASQYVGRVERARAAQFLNTALQYARQTAGIQRAELLRAIANQYAEFDTLMASLTFAEAVRAFDLESDPEPSDQWVQTINADGVKLSFPLRPKGLEKGFAPIFRNLITVDPGGVTTVTLSLKNEQILGEALVGLGAAILKSL